jgi:Uma2 family endonuclease
MASAVAIEIPKTALLKSRIRRPRTVSEYLNYDPRDGFKYEWVNGKLIKRTILKKEHYYIINNLTRFFATLKAYADGDSVQPEAQSATTGDDYRIPDLTYFTIDQQRLMYKGVSQTPHFLVEVISKNDDLIKVEEKLEEYFAAGVQVVWHVIPEFEKIYIYTSFDDVTICRGHTIASAELVIKGFALPAKDVFKKP